MLQQQMQQQMQMQTTYQTVMMVMLERLTKSREQSGLCFKDIVTKHFCTLNYLRKE